MEKEIKIVNTGYGLSTLDRLNRLRQKEMHCDFIIKIDDEKIPAHKIVLCANSEYFRAMLSHDTLESQSGIVEMHETDQEAVKICIEFIYTGRATFTRENAEKVIHVAKLMLLEEFSDIIVDYFKENLCPRSVYETKIWASKYSWRRLEEACDCYVRENFEEIIQAEGFVQCHPEYLFYMMKTKETNVSESKKLHAAINWIRHDPANRKEFIYRLLGDLDLSRLPLSHRRHLIENDPLITTSLECMRQFTISILKSSNIKSRNLEDDQPKDVLLLFKKSLPFLHVYERATGKWNPFKKMKKAMIGQNFSAVSLGDLVFVLMQNLSVYRLKFHEENSKWKKMESMKQQHGEQPPVVNKNGFIYVIGGSNNYTDCGERYDLLAGSWTSLANTNLVCFGSTITATNDAVYKAGGWIRQGNVTDTVEKYEIKTNKWSYVTPMQHPRYNASSIEFRNKIYVLGGFGLRGVKAVNIQVYDPNLDFWETIKDFAIPSKLLSVCDANGDIYAVGKSKTLLAIKLDMDEEKCELVCDLDEFSMYGNLLSIREKL